MPRRRPRRMVEWMHIYPRKCVITGYPNSEANGPVLDTGVDIEGYGRVFVTESGANLVGKHFGLVPQAELDKVKEENELLRAAVARVPAIVEGFLNDLRDRTAGFVPELLGAAVPAGAGAAVVPAEAGDGGEGGADGGAGADPEVPGGDRDDEGPAAAVA